ncbi:hypothetical protein SKAU_G00136280 [Synaphobranchus kaupii]|uniref:Uncharacterized protein n=1 Tax=Synaphobranchus kaupii TaxID=118154 RepID=A0A9Q1FSE2_SYNKA|nr:hypothetical protein SKAU_G00136280 [Synaphobranchus kaupii]
MATLMSTDVRKNSKEIDTMDLSDTDAEDMMKLLKPLKTATTVLCDEKMPTVSLIVPLKDMIKKIMSPDPNDSHIISTMKSAILGNRYTDKSGLDFLLMATAMDPRFHTLPHLDDDSRDMVFARLTSKVDGLVHTQPLPCRANACFPRQGTSSRPKDHSSPENVDMLTFRLK